MGNYSAYIETKSVADTEIARMNALASAAGLSGMMLQTRANGGYTAPGMTLVGEAGPELVDFNAPAMVYSNAQLRSAMGGDETAAEVRALREENRAQSRAMVALQARMTRLIERWDGDGIPEERVVTA